MNIVPVVSVDGQPSRELTADLVKLEIEEATGELPTLLATLVDGHALDVGTAIQVSLGTIARQRPVFDGVITTIEFAYEENGPPVVEVSASAATHSAGASSTSIMLVRGNDLISAHVRVQKARAFVTASGTTTGSPDIRVGSILRLEHIGASFSGDGYSVTRIKHTFDLDSGLTSTFVAQRPV